MTEDPQRTSEATRSWQQRAAQVFTPSYKPAPLVVERGLGAQLWDIDGRVFIDLGAGIGVGALGHAEPRVLAALQRQAARFCHTANVVYHRPSIELAEAVLSRCFGERLFFTNSGTEAMEASLKAARRHFHLRGHDRHEFVATHGSFHGRSLGALSITGQPHYHTGFGPLLSGVSFIAFNDIDAARAAISDATAAFIVEPVQGNSGVQPASSEYLTAVRQRCDETGTLLIFDEIQTGLGRTGHWFAHQDSGVQPDIMTLAKPLGGGLPLGAMVATAAVGDALTAGSHGSTFAGNPLACAAGLATLEVIADDDLVQRAQTIGAELVARLRRELGDAVVDVRGRGLMIGIELHDAAAKPRQRCLEAGLLVTLAGKNVIRLLPPLNIEETLLQRAIDTLVTCLRLSAS